MTFFLDKATDILLSGRWVEHPRLQTIRPYLELMRLHQPTGIHLVVWPAWCGLAIAAPTFPNPVWFILLLLGAIVARSAGCVVNDILDQKFDREVERTKNRPLASGALHTKQALVLLGILAFIGLALLLLLPPVAQILTLSVVPLIVIYPLMKRFTYWPQLFLGATINWGVLVGSAIVADNVTLGALLLYIGCICWTLAYDTVYALQDKADDEVIGVKSLTIELGEDILPHIKNFYVMMCTFWLFSGGVTAGTGVSFYIVFILMVFFLRTQYKKLNPQDLPGCHQFFRFNVWLGIFIFVSICTGKIL